MSSNRGATTLKSKRRSQNPMHEYDNLPYELRSWLSAAILPWRPNSVKAAYETAMSRTGQHDLALEELDRIQHALISKDAARIWGSDHPAANIRLTATD